MVLLYHVLLPSTHSPHGSTWSRTTVYRCGSKVQGACRLFFRAARASEPSAKLAVSTVVGNSTRAERSHTQESFCPENAFFEGGNASGSSRLPVVTSMSSGRAVVS